MTKPVEYPIVQIQVECQHGIYKKYRDFADSLIDKEYWEAVDELVEEEFELDFDIIKDCFNKSFVVNYSKEISEDIRVNFVVYVGDLPTINAEKSLETEIDSGNF